MSKLKNFKVSGNIQDLKKQEKNIKPKQTNFLLTINLNQSYKEGDEHLDNDIQIFDHTIKDILDNVDKYIKLPDVNDWNDDKIKDVDIDYTIERGKEKGFLHIHILFKIKHFTKIQLDYDKIKFKITNDLGLENIYMYNKLIRGNNNDNILEYINKYI
jgi:hypothetical protein